MSNVYVVETAINKFGKYPDKSEKDLTGEAFLPCLKGANLDKKNIEAIWFANSGWGTHGMQTCIRGQVALRPFGIDAIPIINVENACASGSTAFNQAYLAVKSGEFDIVMAVGMEKMSGSGKFRTYATMVGGMDVGNLDKTLKTLTDFAMTDADRASLEAHLKKYPPNGFHPGIKKDSANPVMKMLQTAKDVVTTSITLTESMGFDTVRDLAKSFSGEHSPWMDIYGYLARKHMTKYGSTIEELAAIAEKNHYHASLNDMAQYTNRMSKEEILTDRMVSWPITRSMCAPVGDGAAAAVLMSEKAVKKAGLTAQAVKVKASLLGTGMAVPRVPITERLANKAYETAGLGPDDISLAEVHDATAFGELHQSEALGFCAQGEGGKYAESGATRLGGARPINTSGGLECKGHPIGATGLAMIHEVVLQLQGRAGARQVKDARFGLTQNGGGALGVEEAAMGLNILEKP